MAVKLKRTRRFDTDQKVVLDPDALEPGDTVAMVHRNSVTLYVVARRTKTQIVCTSTIDGGREDRFRAEDGSRVGDSHYSRLQAVFDPEVLDAIESTRMRQWQHLQEKLIKDTKTDCHDARHNLLSEVAELAIKVQKDLVEIRSAQHEWNAAVRDAG